MKIESGHVTHQAFSVGKGPVLPSVKFNLITYILLFTFLPSTIGTKISMSLLGAQYKCRG